MQTAHSHHTDTMPPSTQRGLFWTGVVFAVLGTAAIIWPAVATIAVEVFIAWIMFVWGIVGCVAALALVSQDYRAYGVIAFGALTALGILLIVFPGAGGATLTLILAAAFLVEGLMTVLFSINLRPRLPNWIWMLVSGLCALVLGILILAGWPGTSDWILGLLAGLNFLSSGLALMMMSSGRSRA